MRILLCSNIYPPEFIGGAELIASCHAKTLKQMGHHPVVFAGRCDPHVPHYAMTQDSMDEVPVHRVNLTNADYDTRLVNFIRPEVDRQFEALLKICRPDVVHMHNIIGLSAGMIHLSKLHGARVIVTLHDYWGFCFKNTLIYMDRNVCEDFSRCRDCQSQIPDGIRALPIRMRNDFLALQFADVGAFISPSRYLADRYLQAGIPPHKMHVISNGLDVKRFARIIKTPANGIVRFSFIGYLGEHKGIYTVIEAMTLLKDRPLLRLNIVGDGHLRLQLEQLVREKGLDSKVRFWGKVEHAEMEKVYRETDVQILASVWPENHPVSITESMACYTPVIATRLGGSPELVRDNLTGYLVDPGSPVSLAEAMCRFLDFPLDISAFGERAAQNIGANTLASQVGRMVDLYRQIGRTS